jgi:hypothetical protein
VLWKALQKMRSLFTMRTRAGTFLHTRLPARLMSCRGTRLRFISALRPGVSVIVAASDDGGAGFSIAHPPTTGALIGI